MLNPKTIAIANNIPITPAGMRADRMKAETDKKIKEAELAVPEDAVAFKTLHKYQYARIPAVFYKKENRLNKLRPESKLLYAMLVNLVEWAEKNGVADADGNPYTEVNRRDLQFYLHASEDLVRLAMTELKDNGLVREIYGKGGKCNRIYVCNINNANCCKPAEFTWQYYRLPVEFFRHPILKCLNRHAKLLYPLLINALEWDTRKYFKKDEVPCTVFPRAQMEKCLHASDKVTRRAVRNLIGNKLIATKHVGYKIPQLIYVYNADKVVKNIKVVTEDKPFHNKIMEIAKNAMQYAVPAAVTSADAANKDIVNKKKHNHNRKKQLENKTSLMPMPVLEIPEGQEITESSILAYATDLLHYLKTTPNRKYTIGQSKITAEQMQSKVSKLADDAVRYATDVVLQAGGAICNVGAYLTTLFYNYNPKQAAQLNRMRSKNTKRTTFNDFDQRQYDDLDAVARYIGGSVDTCPNLDYTNTTHVEPMYTANRPAFNNFDQRQYDDLDAVARYANGYADAAPQAEEPCKSENARDILARHAQMQYCW